VEGAQLVKEEEGTLDALTQRLPRGLYTTFRTLDGGRRVFGLRAHLKRLYQPAARLGIQPGSTLEGLRAALRQIASSFTPGECRLRPILLLDGEPGKLYVLAEPFSPPPPELYEKGVAVITVPIRRANPRLKATDFIQFSAEARRRLAESGAYEAIRVRLMKDCPRGKALEGLTSNFYVRRGETLITAREGILPGVTRRVFLRLARAQGLKIAYHPPCLGEPFDEAFLTSSSRGVVPSVQIDHQEIGDGRPGPYARRLAQAYQEYTLRHSDII
ncbi:MAG: aminotransferase class IV, partial [Anaerolineales bacterium]